jgi:hypothetical protein
MEPLSSPTSYPRTQNVQKTQLVSIFLHFLNTKINYNPIISGKFSRREQLVKISTAVCLVFSMTNVVCGSAKGTLVSGA